MNAEAIDAGRWPGDDLEAIVDRRLHQLLPGPAEPPELLHQAMAYSLLARGKRLRPILALAVSQHLGERDRLALDPGCAIEMVHAASLIMDDLPAMDDAELRRGQPTAHRRFGVDVALLASVALLNRAFGVVAASEGLSADARIQIVDVLADAVGSRGLVGGQVLDLRARAADMPRGELEQLNGMKTGALFVAAAAIGGIVAGAPDAVVATLKHLGRELGLAFQIADDILDTADFAHTTGKDTGKDVGKPTLGRVLGPAGARALFHEHGERCRALLAALEGQHAPLGRFIEHCLAQAKL
jgi:geranylgeranyl diphosphate synthase type II